MVLVAKFLPLILAVVYTGEQQTYELQWKVEECSVTESANHSVAALLLMLVP